MKRLLILTTVLAATATCSGDAPQDFKASCDSWTQWGRTALHQGDSCVASQSMARSLDVIQYDTLVEDEKNDAGNVLYVHYQSPLTVDDDVYMMWKDGSYTPCVHLMPRGTSCDLYSKTSQVWSEKGYRWENGALDEKWKFVSDWKPMPATNITFEPMFQPAVSGDFIYVPGAGGTVYKLTRGDGKVVVQLKPFGDTVDPDRYVTGPVTADDAGNVYWNSVKLDHADPYGADIGSADLVKATTVGAISTASYQGFVTGAPAASDLCRSSFSTTTTSLPWPPPDDVNGKVLPPTFACHSQRPSWNVAPAVGPDGTIFTVSRAHATDYVSFLVALNPDLSPKWTTSMKNIYHDGCGSKYLPIDGDADHPFDCRIGAPADIDPNTNELPSGRANDQSSSSPVALPDGSVLYGSFTEYNFDRGHLVKLSATGAVQQSYDFGWDLTPAVWQHDGTYSMVLKDNNYFSESGDEGPYYITQLDANLGVEWKYTSTSTMSCVLDPTTGQKTCDTDPADQHPSGFEWCINAPAVDKNGVVFANSEDGNIYAIPQGGDANLSGVKSFFLQESLSSAYTPLAIDSKGRIYALNDGRLTIIGQ